MHNNIAVIRLSEKLNTSKEVVSACFPGSLNDIQSFTSDQKKHCIVATFGKHFIQVSNLYAVYCCHLLLKRVVWKLCGTNRVAKIDSSFLKNRIIATLGTTHAKASFKKLFLNL